MRKVIYLGSEIVVLDIGDARTLVHAMLFQSKEEYEKLQRRGILEILENLRDAVRRYDAMQEGN